MIGGRFMKKIIFILFFSFFIFSCYSQKIELQTKNSGIKQIERALYCTLFALLLLIFKDIFKNGSIGKRIMKLEIVDSKTKEKALLTKRILRNVTWVLSFIEVIFLIASDKRIGDRIAGTEVLEKNAN